MQEGFFRRSSGPSLPADLGIALSFANLACPATLLSPLVERTPSRIALHLLAPATLERGHEADLAERQLSQGGRRCSDVGTIWDRRERPDRRWIWRWAAAWVGGMAIAVALAWLALHEATNGLWSPIPPQSASVPRE